MRGAPEKRSALEGELPGIEADDVDPEGEERPPKGSESEAGSESPDLRVNLPQEFGEAWKKQSGTETL